MIRFKILDRDGKEKARGEIDKGIYRVFSEDVAGGCVEFGSPDKVFEIFPNCALQPELFESQPTTEQFSLFQ